MRVGPKTKAHHHHHPAHAHAHTHPPQHHATHSHRLPSRSVKEAKIHKARVLPRRPADQSSPSGSAPRPVAGQSKNLSLHAASSTSHPNCRSPPRPDAPTATATSNDNANVIVNVNGASGGGTGSADSSAYNWLHNDVYRGYIKHPDAGWIMHPSYYDDESPLCAADADCTHKRDCKEVRIRMAVYCYIRAERNKTPLSYREVELLWGVSRSTIQRRKVIMNAKSKVMFLVTPYKNHH